MDIKKSCEHREQRELFIVKFGKVKKKSQLCIVKFQRRAKDPGEVLKIYKACAKTFFVVL